MPIRQYDSAFGGKPGAAAKAKAAMLRDHGLKRGTEMFYATVNKRRRGRHR